ncbi:MAG: cupin domain-containing protein [Planctomycetota bacterium]
MDVLGTQIEVHVSCEKSGGSLFAFEQRVPVGQGVPPHTHDAEDEVVLVMSGRVSGVIDGEAVSVGPGESRVLRRGVSHGFTNDGPEEARIFTVVSPGENFERMFAHLEGTTKRTTPSLEDAVEVMARYGMVFQSPE